ncbi:VC0807 family protein [Nocardia sp. CA-128927]|uniref:VC0807 family protein n=1 Tax=Nocardia sp. CA-128927 TaxID=3239975 RepID=UPI003D99C826
MAYLDNQVRPAPGVGSRKAVIVSVLTDMVAPLAVFYGLRAAGVEQRWALLVSMIVPAAVVVYRFVTRRRIEYLALFILTVIASGVVLSVLTGDSRTMLIRDAWAGMIGGLAGVWMLGSVVAGGRPALVTIFRGFLIAEVGADGARAWDARWDTEPDFRRGLRVVTSVWGVATILNAAVNLAFAYTLPIDAASVAMQVAWPVILVPLLLFHLSYTKSRNLRA